LISHVHSGAALRSEIRASYLKFTSGNGGEWLNLGDQGTGRFLGLLCFGWHASVKF
jgi:hypothetical protein